MSVLLGCLSFGRLRCAEVSFILRYFSLYIYPEGRPLDGPLADHSQVLTMPRQPRQPFPATHPPQFFFFFFIKQCSAMFFIARRCLNPSCVQLSPIMLLRFYYVLNLFKLFLTRSGHFFCLFATFRDHKPPLALPCNLIPFNPFLRGNLNLDRLASTVSFVIG